MNSAISKCTIQSAHHRNNANLILFDHYEHQKLITNFNLPYFIRQLLIFFILFFSLILFPVDNNALILRAPYNIHSTTFIILFLCFLKISKTIAFYFLVALGLVEQVLVLVVADAVVAVPNFAGEQPNSDRSFCLDASFSCSFLFRFASRGLKIICSSESNNLMPISRFTMDDFPVIVDALIVKDLLKKDDEPSG
ncbi:hypothetical protein BpHYR1_013779 [Brachionus plicatilis]|uniref:Uncharacterized protein n=1 Tax=Brachionus plicatilis TaxID=10195 RepID=A0A3M7RAP0_BRAPC|nr:hypothetical protein BpHYR1_013779 [Brachionus plicatilis]